MDEQEFVRALQECVETSETELGEQVDRTSTFEDSGLLTSNAGLVVRLDDGSEFQVTVVRSL